MRTEPIFSEPSFELETARQPEQQESSKQESHHPLLRHPEMYRLFSDPPLHERDIQRYVKSNRILTQQIPEIIKQKLAQPGGILNWRWDTTEYVSQAPEEQRAEIIELFLAHPAPLIRHHALRLIKYAPEKDQARLQEQATEIVTETLANLHDIEDMREFTSSFIDVLTPEDQSRLRDKIKTTIEQDLAWQNPFTQNQAIRMIDYAPPETQMDLRRKAVKVLEENLMSGVDYIQVQAAELIDRVLSEDRARLRKKVTTLVKNHLSSESEIKQASASELINHAPLEDRLELVELFLKSAEPVVRSAALRTIDLAQLSDPRFAETITTLVEKSLADPVSGVRRFAIKLIRYLPLERRASLVRELLRTSFVRKLLIDNDLAIRWDACAIIAYLPEQDQLQLFRECLASDNRVLRHTIMNFIEHVPDIEHAQFIERYLTTDGTDDYQAAMSVIRPGELPLLLAHQPTALDRLKELTRETPLYIHQPDKFDRAEFSKSGTRTTLLDEVPGQPEKSFRDQVIIRHIDAVSYLSWRKAFEAAEFWKSKGFDYVPIEPIIKIKLSEDWPGEVAVLTRVIKGPSVETWSGNRGIYPKEIRKCAEKIVEGLKELGIEHGHLHDGNFVLLFERGGDGEPRLDRLPRLYAIDFDEAVSTL
jgi:hypothetical protein